MIKKKDDILTSIIIVNYNAGHLLLDCVESIFRLTHNKIQVIIVDNVSNDQSHIQCKEKFPQIILIENKKNFGYCEANNIGIQNAIGDFIVILNPDTQVEQDWLNELFKSYEKFGDGIYQPKILSLKDKKIINTGGNMIQTFGFSFARGQGMLDQGQFDRFEEINAASGACFFTSASVLNRLGLFDPYIFAYHDDTDLGWKAAQLGIKSHYVPSSVIYHFGGHSYKWSYLKFFLLERNRHYLLLTHYSRKTFYKMLPSLIVVELFVLFYYLSKGFVNAKINSYIDIIKNRKSISQKYHELEMRKQIPDEEIMKMFTDDIFIPQEIGSSISRRVFNLIISKLSKLSKRFIIGS